MGKRGRPQGVWPEWANTLPQHNLQVLTASRSGLRWMEGLAGWSVAWETLPQGRPPCRGGRVVCAEVRSP
jgi:hypothetical protein